MCLVRCTVLTALLNDCACCFAEDCFVKHHPQLLKGLSNKHFAQNHTVGDWIIRFFLQIMKSALMLIPRNCFRAKEQEDWFIRDWPNWNCTQLSDATANISELFYAHGLALHLRLLPRRAFFIAGTWRLKQGSRLINLSVIVQGELKWEGSWGRN